MNKIMKNVIIILYMIMVLCLVINCICQIIEINTDNKEQEYFIWAFYEADIDGRHMFSSEIGFLPYDSPDTLERGSYMALINNNKTINNIRDDYIVEVIPITEGFDIDSLSEGDSF